MSEYQYYEFRAIDRVLGADEMASLRSLSSRAEISPRRLAVTYNYGDFRGDPVNLMHKHFDLMVYLSNFGTDQLLLRIPMEAMTPAQIKPYLAEGTLQLHRQKDSLVLEFSLNLERGRGWVHESKGAHTVEALLPLREMLLQGDPAPLYIGWLGSLAVSVVDASHHDDEDAYNGADARDRLDEIEPPVPAGLNNLAPALESLAEFLSIPDSLLQAAADASSDKTSSEPSESDFARWISKVPTSQLASWLTRLAFAQDTGVAAEVRRQFYTSQKREPESSRERRTAAQLVQRANQIEQARRQRVLEAKRHKQAVQDEEKQKQREAITAAPERAWKQVGELVETRQETNYDRAVEILVVLREVAQQTGEIDNFKRRLKEVRQRYVSKTKFHQKWRSRGSTHGDRERDGSATARHPIGIQSAQLETSVTHETAELSDTHGIPRLRLERLGTADHHLHTTAENERVPRSDHRNAACRPRSSKSVSPQRTRKAVTLVDSIAITAVLAACVATVVRTTPLHSFASMDAFCDALTFEPSVAQSSHHTRAKRFVLATNGRLPPMHRNTLLFVDALVGNTQSHGTNSTPRARSTIRLAPVHPNGRTHSRG